MNVHVNKQPLRFLLISPPLQLFQRDMIKKNLTDPDVFGTENIMNKVSNGVREKELSILI